MNFKKFDWIKFQSQSGLNVMGLMSQAEFNTSLLENDYYPIRVDGRNTVGYVIHSEWILVSADGEYYSFTK